MVRNSLEENTALITGAASGIGRASAYTLAREGANIAGADINSDKLTEFMTTLEDEFRVDTLAMSTNVRKEEEVEMMVKQTVSEFGQLDILACIAGQIAGEPDLENLATEDYRAMMETNIDGLFFSTRAALPYIRESKGNIILIGSFAGQYPRPVHPIYAATKWWTRGLAKNLQANIGDDGVGLTVVNPSETRTNFGPGGTVFKNKFEEGEKTEPEEVAEAVTFAARYDNSTIEEINVFARNKYTDW